MIKIEIDNYKELPYGENIEQKASIAEINNGIKYEILSNNKDLNYVDYLDLTNVLNLVSEFFDVNTTAISKNNHITAVALGSSLENSWEKALDCNPLAITQSTIGFSKTVTVEIAKQIKSMQVKNVLAPKFDENALKILLEYDNINIIRINSPLQEMLGFDELDIKVTPFGYLVQEQNLNKLTKSNFKVTTKNKPTQQQAEDAIFAWKISKYTHTNSAIIAKDLATSAIFEGVSNEIDCIEKAVDYSCEKSKDAVLALDGAIEYEEIINTAIQCRIGLIIEAGNGINSHKITKLADKYNLSMIATGLRNYKH